MLIVTCAANKLESICSNIQNGNITVAELRSIEGKQAQMDKLCEAIITCKFQLANLKRSMKQRLAELEHFKAYKTKLEHFLFHIGKILIGKNIFQKREGC